MASKYKLTATRDSRRLRDARLHLQRVKIVKYIKVSILEAKDTEAARTVEVVHVGVAAVEVKVAAVAAIYSTAPVEAAATFHAWGWLTPNITGEIRCMLIVGLAPRILFCHCPSMRLISNFVAEVFPGYSACRQGCNG